MVLISFTFIYSYYYLSFLPKCAVFSALNIHLLYIFGFPPFLSEQAWGGGGFRKH